MAFENNNSQHNRDLKLQLLLDTSKRAAPGIFIFPVLWPLITLANGSYHLNPQFIFANTIVLIGVALARLLLTIRIKRLVTSHLDAINLIAPGLILCNSLHWGLLVAATIYFPWLKQSETPMIIATIGIAAGGVAVLSVNPLLQYSYPLVMLLPGVIALLSDYHDIENVQVAAMFFAYAIYIVFTSRTVRSDYWNALTRQQMLEQRTQELEEISSTDALTKLRNRLYFTTHFDSEWNRAWRHKYAVSILMIDLDHFKRINDTFGHPFGDDCLVQTATALQSEIQRSGDILARYGGEEFIVFLSNTDEAEALVVAERLLSAVRAISLSYKGTLVPVSCSIGLASNMPALPDQGYQLISEADRALYEAKRQGRNMVVTFDASFLKLASET